MVMMSFTNGFRVSKMPFPITKPKPGTLRQKIDRVDDALYELLITRMLYSRETRVSKNEVLKRLCEKKGGIEKEMIHEIWSCIFRYSLDAPKRDSYNWLD